MISIAGYTFVLQQREVLTELWAQAQYNLGAAYQEHIRGEPAQNLEWAIESYQQALQVYTPQAFPQD
jgi:hypothetical protein